MCAVSSLSRWNTWVSDRTVAGFDVGTLRLDASSPLRQTTFFRPPETVHPMPISDHMKAVRDKIGHDLLATTAVSISIFDAENRLLLGRDAETGRWTLPGGAIDPEEHPADAAVRECFEETGLLTRPQRLIGIFGGPEFLIRYPNGDLTYYTVIAFEAVVIGGALAPDGEEIASLKFVDRTEWEQLPISPSSRIISRQAFARETTPFFAPASWRPEA
jgi:8-oxo-dGTP pyrophosphatase MutT (NUDIX family)